MSATSPHDLRERMEQILLQPASVSAEGLQETAETYARVIGELNQRLTICNRWLDAGLRSEAIHMAKLEPDLLDAMGQLDLGESLQSWIDLCAANGAKVPPRANWEAASFLNDAWDKESQLTEELRSLRLAMLTHRDVQTRLTCLRALLAADHTNAAWDTMAREHEKLRMIELRDELQEASVRNDLKRVAQLTGEIRSADWLEPPPSDLLEVSTQVRNRVAAHRVRKEFEKLADRLHAAMAAGDEAKATQWRGRWEDARSMSGMDAPEDVAATANAAFNWLDMLEQQRSAVQAHELACRQLGLGLDDKRPMEELEPLHFRIQQMDAGVPELLDQRYQDRLVAEGRARRTKLVLRSGMLVVLLALVAAGGWFAIDWYGDVSRANAYETQLRSAINDEDVSLLEDLLARGYHDYPDEMAGDWLKPVGQAEDLIEAWSSDRKTCEQLLADYGSMSDPLDILDSEMTQLEALCKTDEELRLFGQLKTRRNSAKAAVSSQSRQAFQEAFGKAELDFRRWKARLHDSATDVLIAEFRRILDTLNDMPFTLGGGTLEPSQSLKLTNLTQRVEETLDTLHQRRSRVAATDTLIEDLRSPNLSLGDIIETLAMLRDNDPDRDFGRHDEIKRTISAADMLAGIDAWNDVRRQLPDDLRSADPSTAGRLADQLSRIPPANPVILESQRAKLAAYLRALVALQGERASPAAALATFLDEAQPWMNPKLLRLVTRSAVYFVDDPDDLKPPSDGNALWDLGHVVLNNQKIADGSSPGDFLSIDDGERPAGVKPSQFQLQSTGLSQWLETVTKRALLSDAPSDPTTWYLELLDHLNAPGIEMEPNLRLAISARLAHLHQTYSWPKLKDLEAAARHRDILPPDDWPTPDMIRMDGPSTVRAEARAIVNDLQASDIRALRQEVRDAIDSVVRELPPGFEHVGHVWMDEHRNKKAFLDTNHPSLGRPHQIWALVDTGTQLKWRQIGHSRGNGSIYTGDMVRNVLPGMPLFATSSLQE